MLIEGYDEDPLVPGENLLGLPGFWATRLMWLSEAEEDTLPEWFGTDAADEDTAYDRVSDEERWPVFRIPFAYRHTAVMLHRNFADDPGMEWFVTHPEWGGRHGFLATVDGHDAGPGLAWRELLHIASTPDLAAPGVHDPPAGLLLLLPARGDADLPTQAPDVVAEALTSVGAPAGDARRVASTLLGNHPVWGPARWALPRESATVRGGGAAGDLEGGAMGGPVEESYTGSVDGPFEGILLCDGPQSPRFGMRLGQENTRDHSDRLARALGTWPE